MTTPLSPAPSPPIPVPLPPSGHQAPALQNNEV
eukprot:CAMPEP_0174373868 /NCGR_PEP_ID=MMETSP0811_2-20130205/108804_1 /TAXON_ID=73025 ORGANISM="Eutreptiella gymnastica-like, Strain CCMP1594" /NCGR_SAMPLE_ID=MMETSP0811_2 /ASSEMBLY_ACC=CAM_ASM_000667 /LENGTH=32 /DNA_ID= /DNA_START= /DNA_END= /DNA_ORIENTATION=